MSLTLNVQFADDTETVIVAYFGSVQDPETHPNQGQIIADDARWQAYYDALPTSVKAFVPAPESPGA